MTLRLIQIFDADGERRVLAGDDAGAARTIATVTTTYELARMAIGAGVSLMAQVAALGLGEAADIALALSEGRVLAPIDHPDAAHLHVTGTGLTHLGSAEGRDRMHARIRAGESDLTDSMRMFLMGLEGGRPAPGETGVQPEWFYKGDGSTLVGPGGDLVSPDFAGDGGEEPEMAGVYVIGDDGVPWRLGYCLANEFSDHITEKQNYLWLAHSKLRPAALGVEIRTGELPQSVAGMARIWRGNDVLWEKPFLSGEANMSHSLANLEHHHFKYGLFRQPGDVHVHCFGTSTASFADGVRTRDGDVFEITAEPFAYGLRNRLVTAAATAADIKAL